MAKDKTYWETGGSRRYVLDPDDVGELERESGVHEFVNRNPRDKAEDLAYGDYTKKHHTQAAAHHLTHMRASQANGNYGDAKRHKILYDMHIKQLGLDASSGKVPEEIAQHMNNPDAPRPMKFKPHKADTFFLNDEKEAPQELSKAEVAAKLKDMLNRVLSKSVALATGPQVPAPGVVKPKEHVAQAYVPTIPGKRKATTNERRRGLLVPWQIDGSNVAKPSSLKQSELDKASVVDHKAGQQAAPGILKHPEDVEDTVDTAGGAGVPPHKFGYNATPYKPTPVGGVAALRIRARGMAKKDIDPADLEEGSADEQEEHKLGPTLSTKIAADHLKEDPKYYNKSNDDANVKGSRDYVDKELENIPVRDPAKGKSPQTPGVVPSIAEQKKKDGLAKARYRSSREDPDDHGNPKEIAQDKNDDMRRKAEREAREKARPGYVSDEPTYKTERDSDYPHEPGEPEYDPRDDPWDNYATGENCSACGEALHVNAKGGKCYDCRTTKKAAVPYQSWGPPGAFKTPKVWAGPPILPGKKKKPYVGRDEGIRRSKLPPGAPGASKDGVGVQVDKKKEASKKAARGKVKGD